MDCHFRYLNFAGHFPLNILDGYRKLNFWVLQGTSWDKHKIFSFRLLLPVWRENCVVVSERKIFFNPTISVIKSNYEVFLQTQKVKFLLNHVITLFSQIAFTPFLYENRVAFILFRTAIKSPPSDLGENSSQKVH